MPTPVCSKCQIGMRPENNGVMVIETAYNPPLPYKVWAADEWMCHDCGQTVIVGFSENSVDNWDPEAMILQLERARKNLSMVRIWREWMVDKIVLTDELFVSWIAAFTPKEDADGSV